MKLSCGDDGRKLTYCKTLTPLLEATHCKLPFSRLKFNRLLRLGRPVGAVTLSRWEWWWNERWIWGAMGGPL